MIRPVKTHALMRHISRSLPECALVHLPRQPFDLDLARRQHSAYVAALESANVRVNILPEEPQLPDAAFVEDPVVVLDEIAVLGRMGTATRESEVNAISSAVAEFRPTRRIISPGTLEGGDVLRLGRKLFAGLSTRTNREGIRQLEHIVTPFGYQVIPVTIKDCLHLKTAATSPAEGLLIANPAWLDTAPFHDLEIIAVPDAEPWGANTLDVNGTVFVAASAPDTARRLAAKGLNVRRLDIAELQKAEAGLTCLSVLL